MLRPRIICLSEPDADVFQWLSDGWYAMHQKHTPEAQALFAKAKKAVHSAKDVGEATRNLEEAGFEVVFSVVDKEEE